MLALSLAAAPACRSDAKRRAEGEVASLTRHIDALRDAPNEAKAPLLKALSEAPCTTKAACEVKATCVDGYTRFVAAREASEKARVFLTNPDGGTGASFAAAEALMRAEMELNRARELTDQCASVEGELRRASKKRE